MTAADQVRAWAPGPQVGLSPWLSPEPSLSTSGDFATDTFSDPWDFSNPEDLDTTPNVGVSPGSASMGNGVLSVATAAATEIRLQMKWPSFTGQVLPWGRDGWAHPIDAGRYTQTTFSMKSDRFAAMGVRFFTANGAVGLVPFELHPSGGFQTFHFDLANRANFKDPGATAVWGGPIVRFELFTATAGANLDIDWVRLHRADASQTPPAGVPVPKVLSPDEQGGADYATVERGNPWDFAGMDDVSDAFQVSDLAISGGDLTGNSNGNDPFIVLPVGAPLNSDKYHRLTVDVCYNGEFSLDDRPGGGMVGRLIWMPQNTGTWTETQDIVVFPGCNTISIDMVTSSPEALQDEFSTHATGWRGVNISSLRFDLNEDRGVRAFTLRNIKLADDAAFSTSYPIAFTDVAGTAGTTADIFVTTSRNAFDGVKIATVNVTPGTNTFNWTGATATGAAMPNGTYWVYVVMHNGARSGVGYSTGPVRLEKPVAPTPSYYVPLTPARLLDTRTGIGGNLSALSDAWFTELDVTGVGGVPETNVTAVVMNVTVDAPTAGGYLTAWPSREPRPTVSSLNFVPGQTVPNLVTVKVGANGRVNLFNSLGSTHVIADVSGYYTPIAPATGGKFTAVTPSRVLDTRAGVGVGAAGPIGQDLSINLGVTGVGGVPATGIDAVALNVTVADPTGSGFLTVWPAGQVRPNASTHNFQPTLTVANLVLAKVGANGQVSIYNSAGDTHVVADVIGYFSGSGGLFVPVTPTRLEDTRTATAMGTNSTHSMPVADANPVPVGAKAVIVNVTSVNSSVQSFITVWPTNAEMPLASTLNPRPGVAVPNQAYLRVGGGGSLEAFNAYGSTDIVLDVFGYVM